MHQFSHEVRDRGYAGEVVKGFHQSGSEHPSDLT